MQGGSFPCTSRQCLLHQSGALQEVTTITSRVDNRLWRLQKRTTCTINNLIYYILYNCSIPKDYAGSALNIKRRWSKHKSDARKENWENCDLTRHFQQQHQGDMEVAISNLKITLVDHLSTWWVSSVRRNCSSWRKTGFLIWEHLDQQE